MCIEWSSKLVLQHIKLNTICNKCFFQYKFSTSLKISVYDMYSSWLFGFILWHISIFGYLVTSLGIIFSKIKLSYLEIFYVFLLDESLAKSLEHVNSEHRRWRSLALFHK